MMGLEYNKMPWEREIQEDMIQASHQGHMQANEKEADELNQRKRRGHPHLFLFCCFFVCFKILR
jgi:hypothetical protein